MEIFKCPCGNKDYVHPNAVTTQFNLHFVDGWRLYIECKECGRTWDVTNGKWIDSFPEELRKRVETPAHLHLR